MPSDHPAARTAIKYALIQLPSAAVVLLLLVLLRHWFQLPLWLLWTLFAAWVAKDVLLYPVVRQAYEPGGATPGGSLIGARGTAAQRLAPEGYIRVRGELWRAEVRTGSVEAGAPVRIIGLHGLTLQVEPADREEGPPAGPVNSG
jgi:membrane protein implicated in regulation of membrane protease activity